MCFELILLVRTPYVDISFRFFPSKNIRHLCIFCCWLVLIGWCPCCLLSYVWNVSHEPFHLWICALSLIGSRQLKLISMLTLIVKTYEADSHNGSNFLQGLCRIFILIFLFYRYLFRTLMGDFFVATFFFPCFLFPSNKLGFCWLCFLVVWIICSGMFLYELSLQEPLPNCLSSRLEVIVLPLSSLFLYNFQNLGHLPSHLHESFDMVH